MEVRKRGPHSAAAVPLATGERRATYRPLKFAPLVLWRMGGPHRRLVLEWLVLSAVAISSSLLTRWLEWTGIPVDLGHVTVHFTLYLPLLICVPLVLWLGYGWGALPAYLSTFLVAHVGGMPLVWIVIFAFANPLGLGLMALVYRVTALRADLRDLPSVVGFAVVALLASLAGSAGSFVWAQTNAVGLAAVYPVWQGWWLGGWLQSLFVVAPILLLLGPRVETWVGPLKRNLVVREEGRGFLLYALGGALAVLVGYVEVARMFSFAQFEQATAGISDPAVRSELANAIDGLSYPLLVLAAVLVAATYLAYRAVRHWNSALIAANTELAARNHQLGELASTDALTGLANRRHILGELDSEVARSRRGGSPLCVLMIDADHFKAINDRHGHAVGDAVLREIAIRMKAQIRGADSLGRYGGEEFVVLLPDTSVAAGAILAERIRASVAETPVGGVPVTVSIGAAEWSAGDGASEVLLERADRALIAAKAAGRNRVAVLGSPEG